MPEARLQRTRELYAADVVSSDIGISLRFIRAYDVEADKSPPTMTLDEIARWSQAMSLARRRQERADAKVS